MLRSWRGERVEHVREEGVVDPSADARGELLGLIRKGRAAAGRRVHIVLLASECRTDEEIAAALHTNRSTAGWVERLLPYIRVQDGSAAQAATPTNSGATSS
jgi:hypothetical protein